VDRSLQRFAEQYAAEIDRRAGRDEAANIKHIFWLTCGRRTTVKNIGRRRDRGCRGEASR